MSQIQSYSATNDSRRSKQKRPEPQIHKVPSGSSELAYGQSVIVTARWILVVTGLFLIMWNPDPLNNLRIQVLIVIILALMNFYLQAQILTRQKTLAPVVYLASVVDFIVITMLVWLNGGFDSNTYIFYFPAILAISVAFETAVTISFVGSAGAIYFLLCLGTGWVDPDLFPVVFARVLMMVAIAFCGNLYWHLERKRRIAAQTAHEQLLHEIRRESSHQPSHEVTIS